MKRKTEDQTKAEIARLGGYVLPQDIETEEAVLGALMLDKEAVELAFEILPSSQSFYKEEHQHVYDAIKNLSKAGTPIDILTVANELKRMDQYQMVGGAKFIARLSSKISSAAHIEIHCRIILEASIKRSLILSSGKAQQRLFKDTEDVFEIASELEKGIAEAIGTVGTSKDQSAKALIEISQATRAQRRETGMVGISTGFEVIDKATNGMAPGNLIILAARPSMGKTALVLNISRNVVMQKIPVAFFSMEMSGLELIERVISTESGIDAKKLRRERDLAEEELIRRFKAEVEIGSWPFYVDDTGGLTIQSLRSRAISMKRKYGIGLIVVDYLQLMEGDNTKFGQNRETDVSQISRGLKRLGKDLGVPVIALSQLSRNVETRSNKKPILSDLRESGAIEQDADDVWGLLRPAYYGVNESAEVGGVSCHTSDLGILIRLKARHGELGDLALRWNGSTQQFTDYTTYYPPPQIF